MPSPPMRAMTCNDARQRIVRENRCAVRTDRLAHFLENRGCASSSETVRPRISLMEQRD